MPNDTETYGEDWFDNMKAFAAPHGFSFPYDRAQDMARIMALNAHRISSALTHKTSCNTAVGSMLRG
jgi:hypothetical protein